LTEMNKKITFILIISGFPDKNSNLEIRHIKQKWQ
jgi:hypothetical protein